VRDQRLHLALHPYKWPLQVAPTNGPKPQCLIVVKEETINLPRAASWKDACFAALSSRHSNQLAAAVAGSRRDTCALCNVDLLLVLRGGASHPLLDLARHGQVGLLDVGCVLGRCLEEGDAERVGELLQQL